MEKNPGMDWKTKLLLFGGIAGVLVGVGAGVSRHVLGGSGARRHGALPASGH